MGIIFSYFLPSWKKAKARKARARESSKFETALSALLEKNDNELLKHNKSMSVILKECQEINRDVLQDPETKEKTDKTTSNDPDLKVNNDDVGCQNVEAKPEETQMAPPIVGPPPPPPPPGGGLAKLPHGLQRKRKIEVSKKLMNPKWKSVDVHSLHKDAIWVQLADQEVAALQDYLVEKLTDTFPYLGISHSQSIQELSESRMDIHLSVKLKIFQNTAKSFLTTTNTSGSEEIVKQILQCNSKFLTSQVLNQLKNLLPKEGGNNFLNKTSDIFLSPILAINRLQERIDVLLFQIEHNESTSDYARFVKNIDLVRRACRELKTSDSLRRILSIILLTGNVMKSSSGDQLSYGFDISFLTKLKDTKQANKQLSLLDFLIDTISETFPMCLNFQKEIPSTADASCVSVMEINKWLSQHKDGLAKVRTEIGEANFSQVGDKLKDVLTPFANKVEKDVAELDKAISEMKMEFDNVCKYFAYTHENKDIEPCIEFFGYFRTFQEHFQDAVEKIMEVKGKINKKK